MNHPLEFWRGGLMGALRDSQYQRAVDRLFEDLAGARPGRGEQPAFAFNPSCEVSESKSGYLVRFDLPGLAKEQLKIDLHDGTLTVSGERKEEKKEEDRRRHLAEVSYGAFSRSFSFPVQVDAERVEAKYENGVLSVTVPKSEATRARQISVK